MDTPLSLDTILGEFSSDKEAWVLQDQRSKRYVVVPDDRYPGRRPIRFFMSEHDAKDFASELLKANAPLRACPIKPVKVGLHRAIRGIAADQDPDNADAFVMHGPNEVTAWLWDRKLRPR
jgi:hypothetical protein